MKTKSISKIIFIVMFIVACSPEGAVEEVSAPVAEEVSDPVVEEVKEESSEEATIEEALEISFSGDIWPVIEKYALNAHGGKGGVFLESYDDIMEYVVPGNPEESVLYKRLSGDGVPVMPPSGKLPDEILQLFYGWIEQGANNN